MMKMSNSGGDDQSYSFSHVSRSHISVDSGQTRELICQRGSVIRVVSAAHPDCQDDLTS